MIIWYTVHVNIEVVNVELPLRFMNRNLFILDRVMRESGTNCVIRSINSVVSGLMNPRAISGASPAKLFGRKNKEWRQCFENADFS